MIKFQNSHGGNLEATWPEKKCPVCGKGFYPHPGQPWGCAHKDTKGHEVKLCSIPCMRAYEQIDLKRRAMKAAKLLSVKAWLMREDGYTPY